MQACPWQQDLRSATWVGGGARGRARPSATHSFWAQPTDLSPAHFLHVTWGSQGRLGDPHSASASQGAPTAALALEPGGSRSEQQPGAQRC